MVIDAAVLETWGVAGTATLGVIVRPWRLPEAVWAVTGALVLLGLGLLDWQQAWTGVRAGTDVYLFLIGMMALAEVARNHGLFDWLANHAVTAASGSPTRLFALLFGVGIVVTAFLSNDATAVVLTPAVYAAAKAADREPLPYLLICAFIANAASFVLPISNPANLVVYADHMPALSVWLVRFGLPSLLAILATYVMLWLTQRRALRGRIEVAGPARHLTIGGKVAAAGIAVTAGVLLTASANEVALGLPTCLAGVATALLVALMAKENPWRTVRGISWGVLPLVAGLFVLVEALQRTGLIEALATLLQAQAASAPVATAWAAGALLGFGSNLVNNLPAGLVAGLVVAQADASAVIAGAILIGVDLGPNLSVTGSLATILWLVAVRREGQDISAWRFLLLGMVVMPPALLLALGALLGVG